MISQLMWFCDFVIVLIFFICSPNKRKENYVLPSSLRFRPPLRSAKGYKLMVRTGFSFLKLRRYECHSSILRLRALFSRSRVRVEEFCSSKELQTFTKQREKHDRKLRHLLSKRSPVNSGSSLKDKWVMTTNFLRDGFVLWELQ